LLNAIALPGWFLISALSVMHLFCAGAVLISLVIIYRWVDIISEQVRSVVVLDLHCGGTGADYYL
jgi:hypothetical protein